MSLIIKNKNKIIVILLCLLISGVFVFFFLNSDERVEKEKAKDVETYIEASSVIDNKNQSIVKTNFNNRYVAVLEVPIINLKRGLLSLDDKSNNADYNIQTIETSSMPDKKNGNLILAAHSGSSSVSYFKNLHKLKIDDELIVYYKGTKYTYVLSNYYDIDKTGYADIVRDKNQNTLTLVTCKRGTDKQTIFISYLKSKDKY